MKIKNIDQCELWLDFVKKLGLGKDPGDSLSTPVSFGNPPINVFLYMRQQPLFEGSGDVSEALRFSVKLFWGNEESGNQWIFRAVLVVEISPNGGEDNQVGAVKSELLYVQWTYDGRIDTLDASVFFGQNDAPIAISGQLGENIRRIRHAEDFFLHKFHFSCLKE